MKGYYGNFGGQYVPEEIKNALKKVEEAFFSTRMMKSLKMNICII